MRTENDERNENKNNFNNPPHKVFTPHELIEDSLRLLLKSWSHSVDNECNTQDDNNNNNNNNNDNNNNKSKKSILGGNYVREVALIQTAEIILNQVDNLQMMFSNDDNSCNNSDSNSSNSGNDNSNNEYDHNCNKNSNNDDNNNNDNNTANNNNTKNNNYDNNDNNNDSNNNNNNCHSSYLLLPPSMFLKRKNRLKILIERLIQKLLNGMLSLHSKVATQCFSIIEKNSILLRYFVDLNNNNESDDDNNNNNNNNNSNDINDDNNIKMYNAKIVILSDELISWKQDRLDQLIEVLRKNRNHWHPNIVNSSALLFDRLLNYLE